MTTSVDPQVTPSSRRKTPWVAAAAVVALVGVAAAIGLTGRAAAPKPPGAAVGTQLDQLLPADISRLPLVDEYGKPTSLAAFHGKLVVLVDFMTTCQEICPIVMSELNQVDQAVTKAGLAGKVQFVGVTIDPGRDDPARLHAYRSFADLLPNWSLLTGTSQDLASLWKYVGVAYSKQPEGNPPAVDWLTKKPLTYDIGHSDVVTYIDASGNERYVMQGMVNGLDAHLNAGELGFLNDTGRQNLTDTANANWTQADALQVVSWLMKKKVHGVT